MAENKKSFVLYTDTFGLIKHLPDDVAGRLLKHIYAYVNDENPITDELLVNVAFEPIKAQLKRDLVKWEQTLEGRSKAGKASAEAKRLSKENQQSSTNSTNVDFVQQSSTKSTVSVNDNVNVSVNDNVSDNVSDILLKKETKNNLFSFKKKLIEYGFKENLIDDWLKVRKNKKASNTETAFKKFISEIEKRNCNLNEILEVIVSNSWSGFNWEWIDNIKNKNKNVEQRTNTEIAIDAYNSETAKNFRFK
jgi:hypothetical protein